jgi:hypothetical protein
LADRYRIERELDQGGMVTVYLAQDLEHDGSALVADFGIALTAAAEFAEALRTWRTNYLRLRLDPERSRVPQLE